MTIYPSQLVTSSYLQSVLRSFSGVGFGGIRNRSAKASSGDKGCSDTFSPLRPARLSPAGFFESLWFLIGVVIGSAYNQFASLCIGGEVLPGRVFLRVRLASDAAVAGSQPATASYFMEA